jgi:hypothetical protein
MYGFRKLGFKYILFSNKEMTALTIWINGVCKSKDTNGQVVSHLSNYFDTPTIHVSNSSFGCISKEQYEFKKFGTTLLWYICIGHLSDLVFSNLSSKSLDMVKDLLVADASNIADGIENEILSRTNENITVLNIVCHSHDGDEVNKFILNRIYKKLKGRFEINVYTIGYKEFVMDEPIDNIKENIFSNDGIYCY